ncbi:Cof-type HAD-IIB family hydrolase [Loigolactobacillus bifermentans]|uniref:HAD superfamily hydrolase n=1 Tax=Loigolactobacillus bifermentans DSM 20003 TaxID=1423726 RepID=A0A0R1H1N1_9LACO|nr:Cof-type HAD-IIB family hydrolase [Loigolactobacillus bifermentans]KRK40357.1 HAD superfamily hydrolase [Loigolactobacillus bifermentans DSM 20003]QGG59487.1 Cof-type HAD-IIB family hydrolase [Loigolactobacillus bifermentans]
MIKMIALDLDGTLLTSAKTIDALTVRVLQQLNQQGVKIILCTGRALAAIQPYLTQLALTQPDDFASTFNGALVQSVDGQQTLQQIELTKTAMAPIVNFAQTVAWPLDVLDFQQVYHLTELGPSRYQQMNPNLIFDQTTYQALATQPYSKVVIATDQAKIAQGRQHLTAELMANFNIASSRTDLLEFVPKAVTKAAALDTLLAHFGWTRAELMAFGDQANDLSMIESAGIGVAMGNAIPEVKAMANAETVTNDEAGVAKFLQHYFDLTD